LRNNQEIFLNFFCHWFWVTK